MNTFIYQSSLKHTKILRSCGWRAFMCCIGFGGVSTVMTSVISIRNIVQQDFQSFDKTLLQIFHSEVAAPPPTTLRLETYLTHLRAAS